MAIKQVPVTSAPRKEGNILQKLDPAAILKRAKALSQKRPDLVERLKNV